jgi:hypothetical protein
MAAETAGKTPGSGPFGEIMMVLPLTTFRGTLKQLDPSDSDEPARTNAFRWAFPAFLDPLVEDTSAGQLSPYQKIKPRRRRFSGGQFTLTTPLPRKRYYTICLTANGFDAGTLCRELKAYAGSILQQKVDVQDEVDSPTSAERKVININFHDPDGEIASRLASGVGTALSLHQGSDGITFGITLCYQTFDVVIENVIDLRLPATQEWFFETFRSGYGDFWHKPNVASVGSFAGMLGTLMFPDLGGTSVTDAIGYCLRSMGIAAFIYPSAHSDAEIVVDRGIFQYALGFNLLDFRATETINLTEAPTRFDDDGIWDAYKWPITLEIAELSADRDIAERYRGSWRLPGVVKSHEQFFAAGRILGGREVGDWADAEVDARGQLIKAIASKLKNDG